MNQKLRSYKKRMLILCIMLAVVLITSGVSYAIFTSYSSQSDANTLAASCMDLEFNGQNEINLLNTYPISEGEALEQTPYTFTIKNNCDNYIEYYVIASVISTTNKVDSKYVKVSLLGDNDLNGAVINTLESIATPQSLSKYSISENYILKRGDGITKDESRTFNFRMWLDSNNPDIWTSEDVEGKDYQVKISVVGTVRTRPKDDLFVAALIDGEESTSFPTTSGYTASVECTRNGKKVNAKESIVWNGTEWELTAKITNGNVRCNATFVTAAPAPDGWYSAGSGTLLASIRDNNELKTPLTTPGSEVSAHTKDDVESQTTSVSSTYQAYYITYGTGWTANGSNFNLTGTAVTSDTYANSYSSLVGKYLPDSFLYRAGSSTVGTMVTTTNLSSVYYVVSATSSSFVYKQITSNKNTTEALLASTDDDYGTTYYFRGAVKNNYVQFANKCWRIVRINGDGSVKLVLHNDNTSNASSPCASSNNSTTAAFARYSGSSYISAFNSNYNDNAYMGFMYGATGASDYASTHANTNKSTILTNLETWYTNNLSSYESKLADTIWCNDKSTFTTYTSGSTWGTGLGYGTKQTGYGAFNRIYGGDVTSYASPSLICPNDNNGGKLSKFTVDDTINGNGDLTYKIGLLTADEIAFAGSIAYTYNRSTYLQENTGTTWWWSLSPDYFSGSYARVWRVGSGALSNSGVDYRNGLRPVISLISSTNVTGDGTSENPYVVEK